MAFHVPEKYRTKHPTLGFGEGNNGFFVFRAGPKSETLRCIASDGMGWEHVSVSLAHRSPIWAEMCAVKDAFWDEEDWVVQYHPAKSGYINNHPYCLHLWRSLFVDFPTPERIMVGI